MTSSSIAFADLLNDEPDGWVAANGLWFVEATESRVVAEVATESRHWNESGEAYPGLLNGMVETAASVGAVLYSLRHKRLVLGVENSLSRFGIVTPRLVRVIAWAVHQDDQSQLWEASVVDERNDAFASGRVRLISIPLGTSIAGEAPITRMEEPFGGKPLLVKLLRHLHSTDRDGTVA